MIQHRLNESLDGLAGLDPQFLRDPSLLQASLFRQLRDRPQPRRTGQSEQQHVGLRNVPADPPLGLDGQDDLGVRPGRIREQDAQFDPVGQETHSLARSEQDPLGDADGAEPIGPTPPGRGIQILFKTRGPYPQATAIGIGQQKPAGFAPFSSGDFGCRRHPDIAQPLDQRLDDMISHPFRPAPGDQLAQHAPIDFPAFLQRPALIAGGPGDQAQSSQVVFQVELDVGLGEDGPDERSVSQKIIRHDAPPGRASAIPAAQPRVGSSPGDCGAHHCVGDRS